MENNKRPVLVGVVALFTLAMVFGGLYINNKVSEPPLEKANFGRVRYASQNILVDVLDCERSVASLKQREVEFKRLTQQYRDSGLTNWATSPDVLDRGQLIQNEMVSAASVCRNAAKTTAAILADTRISHTTIINIAAPCQETLTGYADRLEKYYKALTSSDSSQLLQLGSLDTRLAAPSVSSSQCFESFRRVGLTVVSTDGEAPTFHLAAKDVIDHDLVTYGGKSQGGNVDGAEPPSPAASAQISAASTQGQYPIAVSPSPQQDMSAGTAASTNFAPTSVARRHDQPIASCHLDTPYGQIRDGDVTTNPYTGSEKWTRHTVRGAEIIYIGPWSYVRFVSDAGTVLEEMNGNVSAGRMEGHLTFTRPKNNGNCSPPCAGGRRLTDGLDGGIWK